MSDNLPADKNAILAESTIKKAMSEAYRETSINCGANIVIHSDGQGYGV